MLAPSDLDLVPNHSLSAIGAPWPGLRVYPTRRCRDLGPPEGSCVPPLRAASLPAKSPGALATEYFAPADSSPPSPTADMLP